MSEKEEMKYKENEKDKMPSTSLINFHLTQLEYVRKCGKHYNEYEECVKKGEKFDICHKLYYQAFINCYNKLLHSGY